MIDVPTLALLDADILVFKAAYWADQDGIEDIEDRLEADIESWTPNGCKAVLCFSCPRHENYRREVYPEYKAHRDVDGYSPDSLYEVKDIAKTSYRSVAIDRLEADDLLAMGSSSHNAIAVSIDKDLRCSNGWHWNPDKEFNPVYVTKQEADRAFYKQTLTGDASDNLKGIHRVGPKTADKILDAVAPEYWAQAVAATYERKGLSLQYLLQMARCIRLLRDGEYNKETKEITLWELPF
jgi:hypothetical protein